MKSAWKFTWKITLYTCAGLAILFVGFSVGRRAEVVTDQIKTAASHSEAAGGPEAAGDFICGGTATLTALGLQMKALCDNVKGYSMGVDTGSTAKRYVYCCISI